MGTNYFVHGSGVSIGPDFNDPEPGLHVGKKSSGWDFLFRAHPGLGLTSVAAWREYIGAPGRELVSEYQDSVSPAEFFEMALAGPGQDPGIKNFQRNLLDEDPRARMDPDNPGVVLLDQEFC